MLQHFRDIMLSHLLGLNKVETTNDNVTSFGSYEIESFFGSYEIERIVHYFMCISYDEWYYNIHI